MSISQSRRSAMESILVIVTVCLLSGSMNRSIARAQLANPGFETCDFSGWTVGGSAVSGVATDSTPISGTFYAGNEVNVRSGNCAAWAKLAQTNNKNLILSQTVNVSADSFYVASFWTSLGKPGTSDAGRFATISVGGTTIFNQYYSGVVGTTAADYRQVVASYSSHSASGAVTLVFNLTGSGTGEVGFSFDDFEFAPSTDTDGDDVADGADNCVGVSNSDQADDDGDGVGNACDSCLGFPNSDADGDGHCDSSDNCPAVPNPTQANNDSDEFGDACDPCFGYTDVDTDGDGFCDDVDNCPGIANSTVNDFDGDGVGNDCDPCFGHTDADTDEDGFCDDVDNCPGIPNATVYDDDGDGVGNDCDSCFGDSNVDTDGDTLCDDMDNCPGVSNPTQQDSDFDNLGDACDICASGIDMNKVKLKIGKLLDGAQQQQLQLQGTMNFSEMTMPLSPLDCLNQGLHIQLMDIGAGNVMLLDDSIPGGVVPNACGPSDGWKSNAGLTVQKFTSKTDALPPSCDAGSALGVNLVKVQDKTAKQKGAAFKIKGKKGTLAPGVGPFRLTVVLGDASAGAAGQCADHVFAAEDCIRNNFTLMCKQP